MIVEIFHKTCPEAITDTGPVYEEKERQNTSRATYIVFNCTRCMDRIIVRAARP